MSPHRYDIYAFIHKGLRAFMSHVLTRVGRFDPHDPAELAEVSAELTALLDLCAAHLRHENEIVHVAMESRRPGSSAAIADDHVGHVESIEALRAMLPRVGGSPEAAHALYQALSVFVGHNFEHMAAEEREHNAVLWATHTDAELAALEHRIRAGIPPERMQASLRWMLPSMNPAERAGVLRGLRAAVPAEAFDHVLDLVRPLIGGRDWQKLSLALAA